MEFEVSEETLSSLGVDKSLMTLIEEDRHHALLAALPVADAKQCSGGSAANTVIATAQLGATSFYSCKVADDATGTFYMKDLNAAGVSSNLTLTNREPGVTGKCIVLITRVQTALTLSDVNMVKFFKDGLEEIIGTGVDLMFCNEEEALMMTGASDFHEVLPALQKLSKRFAVTRGAQGAVLFDGTETLEIPAKSVTPVDANGAGDVYAGTFLYGLTHGMSFGDCGAMAGAAATELVQRFGARLPTESLQAIHQRYQG